MKLRLSFTDGYLFTPRWTPSGYLTFTTITGVIFSAQRIDDTVTWYTTTSDRQYTGTEELLRTHIAACNNGRLFVRVGIHATEGVSRAHFITDHYRTLFLTSTGNAIAFHDDGAGMVMHDVDRANTALWVLASTVPYLKKTTYLPEYELGYVLSVYDGTRRWYLSFGRTIPLGTWQTPHATTLFLPQFQVRLRAPLGIGTPWLWMKRRHEERAISSVEALAAYTGWDVQMVQASIDA